MNKSLIFRNKLYRFCFLLFSFFLFIYLLFVLFNGQKGVFAFHINKKINQSLNGELNLVKIQNNILEDKILRLKPNTLDLDFLDENLILQTGKSSTNEIILSIK